MSAFNNSYPTDTTPWEKAQKASPDFIFFDKAYANFPNTVMAVTQALTSSNQYNKVPLKDAIDIIDVAKKGGYHTYWLSLQNKSTVSDAGVTVLADRADTGKWLHGQDETVIQELQRISTEDDTVNNFIIVHLNGSHFRYDRRVPESFIQSRHLPTSSKEDYYDDSLQYTDYVLQQIYEYGKTHAATGHGLRIRSWRKYGIYPYIFSIPFRYGPHSSMAVSIPGICSGLSGYNQDIT